VATIPGSFRPVDARDERRPWRDDLRDGIRWLRSHHVLWPMAIVLGTMNGADALAGATLVIFAQEVLSAGPFLFAIIGAGGAIGSILGGWAVPRLSKRLGGGTVLVIAVAGIGACAFAVAIAQTWVVVMIAFSITAMLGLGWNVVTVSLRQSVIPDHLLGRVNSVYRFMAWGSIPIGALIGGVLVTVLDGPLDRSSALRAPWLMSAAIHVGLISIVARRLNTAALDAIRPTADAQR
jgi:MFS family permease